MTKVVFYEKQPGAESARAKARLVAAGHEVETRDLMTQAWSAPLLRPYFGEKPVRDWFDAASPRVLSGEIDPDRVNPQAALTMMILDPALIRHPLVKAGHDCRSGLDEGAFAPMTAA
jgi:nitrogenase-associated protein